MKTINIELSEKSIQDAIQQIEEYKRSLQVKTDIFINKMANIGLEVVRAEIETVPDEERGSYYVEDIYEDNGVSIRLTGDKILFIEFGAGIKFAVPQNPKAGQFNMGVGTYPDQTHAFSEYGWWYTDDGGESKHSYGNPAYMPMYMASVEVINRAIDVAREVFGG